MRSDFINKRDNIDRREIRSIQGTSGETGTSFIDREIVIYPSFDTFIFHNPSGYSGGDRWNFLPNGNVPVNAEEIPVGFINPFNDAAAITAGTPETSIAPRTPTRAILGFDLSQIPAGANILSAELSMKIASLQNISPLVEFLYMDGTNQGNWKVNALSVETGFDALEYGILDYSSGSLISVVNPIPPSPQKIAPYCNRVWLRNEKENAQSGASPTQRISKFDYIFSWTGNLVGATYNDKQILHIGFFRNHNATNTVFDYATVVMERFVGFTNYEGFDTWRASIWRPYYQGEQQPDLGRTTALYRETASFQTNAKVTDLHNLKVIIYENGSKAKLFLDDSLVLVASGTGPSGQLPTVYPQAVNNSPNTQGDYCFSGMNHRANTTNLPELLADTNLYQRTTEMWCRKFTLGSLSDANIVQSEKNAGWLPLTFEP